MVKHLKRAQWLVPIAIVLLAAALRLYHLGDKGLWGDELAQAQWSLLPLAKLWDRFRDPPDFFLSFVLVKLAQNLSPHEFLTRLPSALASIVAVAALFPLARRLVGYGVAMAACLLLAVNPYAILYAQDARMYAAHALYAVVAMYFFARLVEKPDWRAALGLSIANGLGAYNHFFGFMFPLIQLGCAVGLLAWEQAQGGRMTLVRIPKWAVWLVGSGVVYGILIVPMLPGTLTYLQNPVSRSTIEAAFDVGKFHLTPDFIQRLGSDWGIAPDDGWRMIVSAGLAGIGLVGLVKARARAAGILVVWLLLPLLLVHAAAPNRVVANRYFIFLQPAYLILVAGGIVFLVRWVWKVAGARWEGQVHVWRTVGATALALLILLIAAPPITAIYARAKLNDWQTIARYLEKNAQPGDVLITEKRFWAVDALENYSPNLNRFSIPPGEIADMSKLVANKRRIWYVSFGGFLNPKEEEWVKAHLERVPEAEWERPDLCYARCGDIRITQSEELVTLYRNVGVTPTTIMYGNQLGTRADLHSYLPVRAGLPLVARLSLQGTGTRELWVQVSKGTSAPYQVLVNGVVLEDGSGSSKKVWRLPLTVVDPITVQVMTESADKTVQVSGLGLQFGK